MINLNDFLTQNVPYPGSYALVKYKGGNTHPVYYARYQFDKQVPFFMESPLWLTRVCEVQNPEEFCRKILDEYYDYDYKNEEEARKMIEEFIQPMIYNGWFYDIDTPQCLSELPEEVEEIRLISERECLEYLINHSKFKS